MPHDDQVKQVGGNHYGTNVFGHWDYCKAADTPYLEGNATKYLYRWRKKGGIQDLEKALSYVDKRLEGMPENYHQVNTQVKHFDLLEKFLEQNSVETAERIFITAILGWQTHSDLLWSRHQLASFILQQKMEKAAEADKNYTNQG